MLFGVAEDHASNPIKIALGKLKAKGVKVVAINPIRTGYGAIADEWIGIRPGTDGLFVGALIHELMRAQKIDLDYLVRFTNAHWLVIDDPAGADDGLFARDAEGKPLAFDKTTGALADATRVDIAPALVGTFKLPDGRSARPSFALIAERFLDATNTARTRSRQRPAIPAETIRRIAARAGARRVRAAGHARHAVDRHRPAAATTRWSAGRCRCTPCAASRRIPTASRPAGCCICCRSCWARSIAPAASATRRRFRGRRRRRNRPARRDRAEHAAEGRAARLPARAGGSAGRRRRQAAAHRQGLFLGRADRRPRPDAHGHHQRGDGRSLSGRRAVHVHGQHELEFVDEHSGGAAASDREGRGDRRIQDSEDHLLRRLFVRDGRLRRPDPAGHHLSRTLGLHLAARPADLRPRRPGRRDPPAGGRARPRRARRSRACCSTSARGSELPGFVTDDRRADDIPAAIPTTSSITSAARASARLPAFAAPTARATAAARRIRSSSNPISPTAASTSTISRRSSATTSTPTRPISTGRRTWASSATPTPIMFQLYLEPLQKFRLAARGHGAVTPPATPSRADREIFRSDSVLVSAVRGAPATASIPFSAITQRPMHIYHSWGSHNGWLRQITAENCLYIHRDARADARHRRRRLGLDRERASAASRAASG